MSDRFEFGVFSHIARKDTVSVQERLEEFAREVRLTDELGYDYFFTTEHHFSGSFSLSPSQAVTLTVIAQNSKRLRFGPLVVQLPISQPLRVAEEMLILDHMSGGRLEVGFGRGITPHEHTSYGIPTRRDRAMFEEGMAFVMKALTTPGPISWVGEHYHYVDVDIPWRPLQQPHPPVWVPTNTPASAYEYGKLGYATGGFAIVGIELYKTVFAEYRRGAQEAGVPLAQQRVCYLADTFVADTDEEAELIASEHFLRHLALFEDERRRTRAVLDPEMQKAADASLARMAMIRGDLRAAAEQLRFVYGSPETVAAKINRLREELGITIYLGEFSFGELSWEQVERSHRLFATKVMPLVTSA